jgi:nitroreductase
MAWNLDQDRFADIVADAVRAPSMHNTQPWRFRLTGPAIELLLDPQRALPVGDPTGRAARVGCGAALYNLRLALATRGTPAHVALRPDPDDDTILARLTPAPPRPPTPLELRLHAAIPRRHSNRQPFTDVAVPAAVRTELVRAAHAEGAWLHLAESAADAEATIDLVREADRMLRGNPAYVAELRTWTRVDDTADEGVPLRAAGPEPDQFDLLARRDFGGRPTAHPFEREPLIAVLGGSGDLPADDITAGAALQRVLLAATDLGLAASIFTQPIDIPTTRDRLRIACRRPYPPHAVLRLGYGTQPHRASRRAVDDAIVTPPATAQ